jgi:hypothetical protein
MKSMSQFIMSIHATSIQSECEECLVLAVKQEATSSIQRRLVHFFLSWEKKRDREVLDLSYTKTCRSTSGANTFLEHSSFLSLSNFCRNIFTRDKCQT